MKLLPGQTSNDPTGQYVDMGTNWSIGGSMSVSVWFYLESYTNWARLIDMGNGADVDNIVFAHIGTTDRIAVSIKDTPGGSSEDHHQNGAASLNKWTHIAFTVTDSLLIPPDIKSTGMVLTSVNQVTIRLCL